MGSRPEDARADLHVHTSFSGWGHLRLIGARDCYVAPDVAFETARARGMDFVFFTDHDSISGALDFLSRRPEEEPRVVVGEEVETRLPESSERLHLSVFGVDERLHEDIAHLRGNGHELIGELSARGIFFSLNHPLRGFRSIRSARRHLESVLPRVPAVEISNGADPRDYAAVLRAMIESGDPGPKVLLGGSDAHRASRIGTVYTAAPATSKSEYLECLRLGRCSVGGSPQGLGALIRDVYAIVGEYYGHLLADLCSSSWRERIPHLAGAAALVPAVVCGVPLALTIAQALRQEWIARFVRLDVSMRGRANAEMDAGTT